MGYDAAVTFTLLFRVTFSLFFSYV